MAIEAEQLEAIDEVLAAAVADHATLAALRRVAPGLSATRCDRVDVQDETPFRSYEHCDLFLLDGREHCVKITSDPAVATGLVLAPRR
jgi:hypothetical protein